MVRVGPAAVYTMPSSQCISVFFARTIFPPQAKSHPPAMCLFLTGNMPARQGNERIGIHLCTNAERPFSNRSITLEFVVHLGKFDA